LFPAVAFAVGIAFCAWTAAARAESTSSLLGEAEPKSYLRWLGPLAPRASALPPVPSPLRDPDQVWTIEKALVRTLQANSDVQVALANVQRQDGLRLQTAAALLPRLGISGSLDRRAEGLIDRSAGEFSVPPILRTAVAGRAFDVRLGLRQNLFDGLSSWRQIQRMAVLKKKASVDARELFLRVASTVRQAYDAVLFRQTILGTRRDAVRDLAQLSEVARKRFTAGQISEFESLRAESALRSSEADLAQAEADLARAQEMLCRILNIDTPAQGLRLTGSLALLEYREPFLAALSRAQAGRLDLRSAELQLEAAQMANRAVLGGYLPRLEAFADYGRRSSYYDYNRHLEGWTVGITGRWDIFDGGQTAGAARAQRAERRIAEIRLAETQKTVGSQIRELFAGLDQQKTVMAAQASARDLAGRSRQEAQRLFEVGRVSTEQVLNTDIAFRQASLGYLAAVFTYNTTVYQLDYATANEAFLDAVTRMEQ
jgi:outer membrane protein TolC